MIHTRAQRSPPVCRVLPLGSSLFFATLLVTLRAHAAELDLPVRPPDAPGASAFCAGLESLGLDEREERIFQTVMSGNVPDFYRTLVPVTVHSGSVTGTVWVACDYLTIGSNEDFMLMPASPMLAQRLADALDCTLPTPRMVDAVHTAAAVRLPPTPIPPSPKMTTVPVFRAHHEMVWDLRRAALDRHPLGALTSGHKKDVVLSARLGRSPSKVAIYGWHTPGGSPIQPLYTGHTDRWVDYSHGIRLVRNRMTVNGGETTVQAVLRDPDLASLLSDEGPLTLARYPTNTSRAQPRSP